MRSGFNDAYAILSLNFLYKSLCCLVLIRIASTFK